MELSSDDNSLKRTLLGSSTEIMPVYVPTAEAVPLTNADLGGAYNPADPFDTKFTVYNAANVKPVYIEEDMPEEEVEEDGDNFLQSKGPKWEIHGSDMQVLHIENISSEFEFTTEVGSTMYLSPGIRTNVECALCGDAAARVLAGENCIKVRFK